MDSIEIRKDRLFATALSAFKRYTLTKCEELQTIYWNQYKGFYMSIAIMEWEIEFHDYCKADGYKVLIP